MGSAPPRPRPVPFPSRSSRALKRRLVAGALVLFSVVLITIYFRESAGGPLHGAQSVGSSALRPFEVAAERIARPFRDAYGYLSGLVSAKSENARLRTELDRVRQQLIQNQSALEENVKLKKLLHYSESLTFPKGYRGVPARVLVQPPGDFDEQIVVSEGSGAGIRRHAPVVTSDGLVGEVTKVTPDTSLVTLLTDDTSAVSGVDLQTRARGVVQNGQAGSNSLVFNRVSKEAQVQRTHDVVTAGWRASKLGSIYPGGIPIGKVLSVGQTDTDIFKQIQIEPFVDFSSLDAVLVLVSAKRPPRLP